MNKLQGKYVYVLPCLPLFVIGLYHDPNWSLVAIFAISMCCYTANILAYTVGISLATASYKAYDFLSVILIILWIVILNLAAKYGIRFIPILTLAVCVEMTSLGEKTTFRKSSK